MNTESSQKGLETLIMRLGMANVPYELETEEIL